MVPSGLLNSSECPEGISFAVQFYKLTQEDPNKYSDANLKQLGPQLSAVNVTV